MQLALGFTHSNQPEVKKHADLFARQKLTEFINSLAKESKHYKSNLEVEKAPEVLYFVLTEIFNKCSLEGKEYCANSDSVVQNLYSYHTIYSRLLLCLSEAYPISKETRTFVINSPLSVHLQLTQTKTIKHKDIIATTEESLSNSSAVEAYTANYFPISKLTTTNSCEKLLNELFDIKICMNSLEEYLGDMSGSNNPGGSGVPTNSSLSGIAAVAAMAAATGGNMTTTAGTTSGTGASGTATQGKSHLENALPELVRECGYQFTVSVEGCRNNLRNWIGANGEIHAATVARIIGVMVRTHTGLDDTASLANLNATGTSLWGKDKDPASPKTWNLEVFIKVVHELPTGSTLHWKEIIYELDHPGFLVKDRHGLILLIKALQLGFQVQGFNGPFPVDMFYRQWKNSDGQVSLLQQILRHPEIFNFSEHHHHPVAVEVLKGKYHLNWRLRCRSIR